MSPCRAFLLGALSVFALDAAKHGNAWLALINCATIIVMLLGERLSDDSSDEVAP